MSTETDLHRILRKPVFVALFTTVALILFVWTVVSINVARRAIAGKRRADDNADQAAATVRESLTLNGHTGEVMNVAFSPDGQRLWHYGFVLGSGEEHGAFDGELELALREDFPEDVGKPQVVPEAIEYQGRADANRFRWRVIPSRKPLHGHGSAEDNCQRSV